jgi:hypothetical protein
LNRLRKVPFDQQRFCRDVAALVASEVSRKTTAALLRHMLWGWTERYGKFVGCQYWSVAALSSRDGGSASANSGALRHEHVVPRRVVAELLLGLEVPDEFAVQRALERFALGCVVTADEASRLDRGTRQQMPPEFSDQAHAWHMDPWARYRRAGVEWRGPLTWIDGRLAQC